MTLRDLDLSTLLIEQQLETREALGRIEAKVDGAAEASEYRHRHLHKRIDRVEERLEKTPTSGLNSASVLGGLITHWKTILTIALVVIGLVMGKSPEEIRQWLGLN